MTEIKEYSLSCIVPARNESGHLKNLISDIAAIDYISEIIIVEGGSTDDTWDVVRTIQKIYPMKVKILQQSKRGKFNAVLEGASIAKGKMILIWDADGTVSSFDTIRIIEHAFDTKGPVIGNRLRGTIAPGAMRRANFLGNWVFAFMWSPILLDTPKDMLCGTKIFDIETFTHLPRWLINADPYGDFALVAFAKSRGLRIQSLSVDYHSRKYGETNIHRWSGGYALLKCTFKIYYWLLIDRKSKPKSQQKLV